MGYVGVLLRSTVFGYAPGTVLRAEDADVRVPQLVNGGLASVVPPPADGSPVLPPATMSTADREAAVLTLQSVYDALLRQVASAESTHTSLASSIQGVADQLPVGGAASVTLSSLLGIGSPQAVVIDLGRAPRPGAQVVTALFGSGTPAAWVDSWALSGKVLTVQVKATAILAVGSVVGVAALVG